MCLDDATADVQAEADPGLGRALHVRRAIEAVEDPIAFVLGDADAMVGDEDPRFASFDRKLDLGKHPAGRVLDRVLDEVVDHLLEARRVDRADRGIRRDRHLEVDALVVIPAPHRLHHGAKIVRLQVHHLGSLLQPLRVEELGDEIAQSPGLADHPRDPRRIRRGGRIARNPPLEQLGLAEDDRQRRAQVVGGRREELLLESSRLLPRVQAARHGRVLARLQQEGGMSGHQLEEPEVVLDEDRRAVGVDRQDADAAIIGRDRCGDDRGRKVLLVDRRVLRVELRSVEGDDARLLLGRHVRR